MLEKINFNNSLFVYKTKYSGNYNKNQFLNRVEQNFVINGGITDDNTSLIKIQSKEFNSIYKQALDCIKLLCGIGEDWDGVHLHTNWIYRQNKNSKIQNYHTHVYTHTKAKILNNWSYCYYLCIPKNVKNNEGYIKFMDDKQNEYSILPEEGDIIFFTNNTLHSPSLTPNSDEYRISICGNISFNVPQIKNIKSII